MSGCEFGSYVYPVLESDFLLVKLRLLRADGGAVEGCFDLFSSLLDFVGDDFFLGKVDLVGVESSCGVVVFFDFLKKELMAKKISRQSLE